MITLLLSALLAAAAPAKHHAPAPAPAADAQTAQIEAALRQEGFSPAGIKAIEAKPADLQDRLAAFRARASAIGQRLAAAKAANDADGFGEAMRAGDALNAEIQRTRTEQLLHTLTTLSPGDRTIFLRHIGPPATQAAAAPAAPQGR